MDAGVISPTLKLLYVFIILSATVLIMLLVKGQSSRAYYTITPPLLATKLMIYDIKKYIPLIINAYTLAESPGTT